MDPFAQAIAAFDGFLGSASIGRFELAVDVQSFANIESINLDTQPTGEVEKFYQNFADKYKGKYKTKISAYTETLDIFDKHLSMLESGKVPAAIAQKSHIQFKKEQESICENYEAKVKQRSKEDFVELMKANQAWLQQQKLELDPKVFIVQALDDAHKDMVEKTALVERAAAGFGQAMHHLRVESACSQASIGTRKEKVRQ